MPVRPAVALERRQHVLGHQIAERPRADRASARCGRPSPPCAPDTAPATRARAACRRPAGWSLRGSGAGRRRAASGRSAACAPCGDPRPSRNSVAGMRANGTTHRSSGLGAPARRLVGSGCSELGHWALGRQALGSCGRARILSDSLRHSANEVAECREYRRERGSSASRASRRFRDLDAWQAAMELACIAIAARFPAAGDGSSSRRRFAALRSIPRTSLKARAGSTIDRHHVSIALGPLGRRTRDPARDRAGDFA